MNIGIIGAGKVGTTIGKVISDAGQTADFSLTGFYSRSPESARESADFTNSYFYDNLSSILNASDILFVTVTDGEISNVWNCIAKENINKKIICHFSGSLSSEVFENHSDTGAAVCSFHPVYAFSNKFTSFENFKNVQMTAEGDDEAISVLRPVFEHLGCRVRIISPESKVRYHAAMVSASNFMVGLIGYSVDMLVSCGFKEDDAYAILKNLTEKNVSEAYEKGVCAALTGPVERGDFETVRKHISALSEDEVAVYEALNKEVIKIADRKHTQEGNHEKNC